MSDEHAAATQPEQAELPEQAGGEVETKAREMGWRPQDEWDGPDDRWMPADEFVERNERLQKKADSIAQNEIKRLEGKLGEMERTISDLGSHLKKADRRALEKAHRELQSKQRQAVQEGDTKAFDEAQQEMTELQKEVRDVQAPQQRQQGDDVHEEFPDWHKDNPWFGDDYLATADAEEVARVINRQTGKTGRELYDAVAKEVAKRHPHILGEGDGRRQRGPAVEGAQRNSGGGKTKWDQVPREDREAFKRFVKQGLYQDSKEDREKYADIYLNG